MTKEQLGQLVLSSEKQLYATSKTILSNDQDCADAIQETIVKAFSKIHTLKNDSYGKTWLIRILINECHNIIRKGSNIVDFPENYQESLVYSDERQDYSEVHRAVNELQEELRIPMILYYMEEFSTRDIAQILEISEGAVRKRIARARQMLKKTIDLEEVFA